MKRNYKLIIFFVSVSIFVSLLIGVNNGFGEEIDPLVTYSYVEMKIEQLKEYIDQKLNESEVKDEENSVEDIEKYIKFMPVELKVGDKLIGGEGSEIVLRSGKGRSIASSDGGMLNVTTGVDLQDNEDIPLHHLLVVPRDDERGVRIISARAFAMVKGKYTIK